MEPLNPYSPPRTDAQLVQPAVPAATFGDVFRAGLALYSANAGAVVTLTLAVWGPLELIQSYADHFIFDVEDFRASLRLGMILENVFGIVSIAGVIAIGDASLRGEKPTWWYGFKRGVEAWPRMFWTRLVVGFLTLIGLVLLVVPGIFVWARTILAEPIAVLEGQNGMAGVRRSFELTRPAAWRMFGIAVLLTALAFALAFALGATDTALALAGFEHWFLTAATSFLLDLFAAWISLTFVAAYWSLAHPPQPDEPQQPLADGLAPSQNPFG